MRILLLTPVPPSATGPGAIPALLHAGLAGLSERNEVTIATSPGPDPWELDAISALVREGYDVRTAPRHLAGGARRWTRRARLAGSWLRGREPWRTVWFHEPLLQPVLDQLLATRRFDVVAVEDNSMATFRFRTEAALVLTEHEVRRRRRIDWHLGGPRDWPGWAFREADWHRWPRYQRAVWRRFDAVQVFSERDAASVVELAPDIGSRLQVNPFGIDVPDLSAPVIEEPNVVGFVGNYTHPPNVDAAVWLAREILPRVRARVPHARLRLAGVHAPPAVRELASADVEFLGFQDDVGAFLRACAVVAAPVRTGGGMRMKVLHGMALQKAVVTTARGASGLACNGAEPPVVVGDDANALAHAIGDLLTDPGARRRLGERARAHVEEHFSAGAYGRRLEAVYEAARAKRTTSGSTRL
jgi:glycosyltransferase involved in cell wall biosynthesis